MALVVLCGASFYVYKTGNISETYENKESKKVNNNMLSMMLETSAGSGEYQKTSASAWPTEGYVFNETLSKCEKGSSLSWDSTKNTVVMMGNNADRCYVYFDIKPLEYLVDHIKSLYTTQGSNNLYLHDNSLTNGAEDNSYRYAGSSDTTNNFICFGYDSTDGSCPTDNLYRIIGVFDNQIKLIKYDYANSNLLGTDGDYEGSSTPNTSYYKGSLTSINTYYWSSNGINMWSISLLNKTNLNTNYLNNIGTIWSNKIAMHTWKIGGNTETNIKNSIPATAYQNEIINPAESTTYDAKIGLMYVSDYGYAATKSVWNIALNSYNNISVISENWMYMGLYESTISHKTGDAYNAFNVYYDGSVSSDNIGRAYAIRPCFYLNQDVTYVSGNGTKTEPFLIK